MLPLVRGVIESMGMPCVPVPEGPKEGGSTLSEGVLLSDALEDARLRGSPALYAFSPWVSLHHVSAIP